MPNQPQQTPGTELVPRAEVSAPAGEEPAAVPVEGTLIAERYEVIREIGRGGMGVVFLARDVKLKRHVAIKRLVTRGTNVRLVQRRFFREAQAIASMHHMNIVGLYDIGQDDQGHYIIMEYVPGPKLDGVVPYMTPPLPVNLDTYIKATGPLGLEQAAWFMGRICVALSFAHQQGIIHRDIKPSNILLDPGFEPKLVDFGLARPTDLSKNDEITLEGTLLGTPEYSAPEQWGDAKAVDIRADIFAATGVLWFCISGKIPRYFREAECAPGWRELLAKGLAQKPSDRFNDMGEFAVALEAANRTPSSATQSTQPDQAASGAIATVAAATGPAPVSLVIEGQVIPAAVPLINQMVVPVAAAAPSLATFNGWLCPNCKRPNPEAASYCVQCGACGVQNCSVCNAEFRVGTQFCPKCGVDIKKAEQAAGILLSARNHLAFLEYESAANEIKDLVQDNNPEAKKLSKELRDLILQRRNLLMDLDAALRVFNTDKAVQSAIQLKRMVPDESLSESADFEVVVRFSELMEELNKLLREGANRARDEHSLEKFATSIGHLTAVFGEESCRAINAELQGTYASLTQVLTRGGLASGMACYSRAMEILATVAPWRGGDLGDRRTRLQSHCEQEIEAREQFVDRLEAAIRESHYADALMIIRDASRFRLPPRHSEMEPAPADLKAHERILEIDGLLVRKIEEQIPNWIRQGKWQDISNSLAALRGGDSSSWKRLSERLREGASREVVKRYNHAVEYERRGRMARAAAAWEVFLEIPQDLLPMNLLSHANEFSGRRLALLVTNHQKLAKWLVLCLTGLWLFYVLRQGWNMFGFTLMEPPMWSALGMTSALLLVQALAFSAVILVLRSKFLRQADRSYDGDGPAPRLLWVALLAAFSPLAFTVFDLAAILTRFLYPAPEEVVVVAPVAAAAPAVEAGMPVTAGAVEAASEVLIVGPPWPAAYGLLALVCLWLLWDWRRGLGRLPLGLGLTLGWCIVAPGAIAFFDETEWLIAVWPMLSLAHGLVFLVFIGVQWWGMRRPKPKATATAPKPADGPPAPA